MTDSPTVVRKPARRLTFRDALWFNDTAHPVVGIVHADGRIYCFTRDLWLFTYQSDDGVDVVPA